MRGLLLPALALTVALGGRPGAAAQEGPGTPAERPQEGQEAPPAPEPPAAEPAPAPQEEQGEETPDETAEGTPESQDAGADAGAPSAPVQETPPPASVPDEEPTGGVPAAVQSPAPTPARPLVSWPMASDLVARHVRGIVETYPEVASLEVVGRSEEGREILALLLGAGDPVDARARPALVLADHRGASSAGPEAALALAWRLAEDYRRDPAVQELLTRATLVVLPTLDPDRRASVEPAGTTARPAVEFDQNFPSGWRPATLRPGSGRISLARPETLAAARFLTELPSCAVVLGFAPPAPRGMPYEGAVLPEDDRAVLERLATALELEGAAPVLAWNELGTGGGAFLDFAYQARGVYPLALPLPPADTLGDGGFEAFAASVEARVRTCLALLPRLEVVEVGLERLGSASWQLEVSVRNVGAVPTSSAVARERGLPGAVSLSVEGAKLVATARRPESGVDFTLPAFQEDAPFLCGTLAGGEGVWLRLFLDAATGDRVGVLASSRWAGVGSIALTMP